MSALDQAKIERANSFMVSALSGSVAGIGQVLSGQPFDIIKVRLQNQIANGTQYISAIGCAKSILKDEGPLAVIKLLYFPSRY